MSVLRAKTETVSFPDAIQAVIDGYRISKREWANTNIFGCLLGDRLMIHKADGYHPWILNTGDLFGEDWIILNA